MILALMGWVLASGVLYRLSDTLVQLRRDRDLLRRLSEILASRTPYPKLMTWQADTKPRQQVVAGILAGLRRGADLSSILAAAEQLVGIDSDLLARQRQMTRMLLLKGLVVMASCFGFRLYFLPMELAALPGASGPDVWLCGLAGLIIFAVLSWWCHQLPALKSVSLRQSGYSAWLAADGQKPDKTALRLEGAAALPRTEQVRRELSRYRPIAEEQTRRLEDLLGVMDLGGNGLIALLTLASPLSGAFSGFGLSA